MQTGKAIASIKHNQKSLLAAPENRNKIDNSQKIKHIDSNKGKPNPTLLAVFLSPYTNDRISIPDIFNNPANKDKTSFQVHLKQLFKQIRLCECINSTYMYLTLNHSMLPT